MSKNDLNSRQELFCLEYADGKTMTDAYLDAGYNPKDRITACKCASRLLKNDEVWNEYQRVKNIKEGRTASIKNTAVAKSLDFILQHMDTMEKIIGKIEKGIELTDEEKMLWSSFMSIIGSLSRDNSIQIQQNQAQDQAQGQSGSGILQELHEYSQKHDPDDKN